MVLLISQLWVPTIHTVLGNFTYFNLKVFHCFRGLNWMFFSHVILGFFFFFRFFGDWLIFVLFVVVEIFELGFSFWMKFDLGFNAMSSDSFWLNRWSLLFDLKLILLCLMVVVLPFCILFLVMYSPTPTISSVMVHQILVWILLKQPPCLTREGFINVDLSRPS